MEKLTSQLEQRKKEFEAAKQISLEDYTKLGEGSFGTLFKPVPEGFEIRMDRDYWYFRHIQSGEILRTYAESSPRTIAEMLDRFLSQQPLQSQ